MKFSNDINAGQVVVAGCSVAGALVMVGVYWGGFLQLQKDVAEIKLAINPLPAWVANLAHLEQRMDQQSATLDLLRQQVGDLARQQAATQAELGEALHASHIDPGRR